MKELKRLFQEEGGAAVIESILILVVVISLVLIFKSEITDLIENIFDKIFSQAGKI